MKFINFLFCVNGFVVNIMIFLKNILKVYIDKISNLHACTSKYNRIYIPVKKFKITGHEGVVN